MRNVLVFKSYYTPSWANWLVTVEYSWDNKQLKGIRGTMLRSLCDITNILERVLTISFFITQRHTDKAWAMFDFITWAYLQKDVSNHCLITVPASGMRENTEFTDLKNNTALALIYHALFKRRKDASEILKSNKTPYLHNKETIRDIIVPGNFKREGRTKSSKILKHITCSQSIIQETLWENQESRNQLNSRVNRAKLSCQF